MSLQDWRQAGWLTQHRSSREEIEDLLALADRDMLQAETRGLIPDWQLGIAYNAVPQCATAALAASGYRVRRGAGRHYRTIQSLELTVGWSASDVALLDAFRRKRNAAEYERSGSVSVHEAQHIRALAQRLRADVQEWLQANHPTLL